MLHLSNISINLEYLVMIQWNRVKNQHGSTIQESHMIFLNHEHQDAIGDLTMSVLQIPVDSPNAKLLEKWRDRQLTIREQTDREELKQRSI